MLTDIQPTQTKIPRSTMLFVTAAVYMIAGYGLAFVLFIWGAASSPPDIALPVSPVLLFGVLSLASFVAGMWVGVAFKLPDSVSISEFYARMHKRLVLQGAFFETIAVYGFLGSFFGMSERASFVFIGLSVVLNFALLILLMQNLEREKRMEKLRG